MYSEKTTLQNYLHFEQYDVKSFHKEKSFREKIEIPIGINESELSLLALKCYFVEDYIQNYLNPEDLIILNHIYKSEMYIANKKYYVHINIEELLVDLIHNGYDWTKHILHQRMIALLMVKIGIQINGKDDFENNVSLYFFDYNLLTCSDDEDDNINMLVQLSNDILEIFIYKQSGLVKLPIEKQVELTANQDKRYEPIEAKEYIEYLNAIAEKL